MSDVRLRRERPLKVPEGFNRQPRACGALSRGSGGRSHDAHPSLAHSSVVSNKLGECAATITIQLQAVPLPSRIYLNAVRCKSLPTPYQPQESPDLLLAPQTSFLWVFPIDGTTQRGVFCIRVSCSEGHDVSTSLLSVADGCATVWREHILFIHSPARALGLLPVAGYRD